MFFATLFGASLHKGRVLQ